MVEAVRVCDTREREPQLRHHPSIFPFPHRDLALLSHLSGSSRSPHLAKTRVENAHVPTMTDAIYDIS